MRHTFSQKGHITCYYLTTSKIITITAMLMMVQHKKIKIKILGPEMHFTPQKKSEMTYNT